MNKQRLETENETRKSIRNWVLFFVFALVLSGITAFDLETELAWLDHLLENSHTHLYFWIDKVYKALENTNKQYPFLAYGYDWLAFGHLAIAVAFFGVIKDPVRNKWVIQFGRIACCMIFPVAFMAGYVRKIPFFWQLTDCAFGILGLIPLTCCYNKIKQLERYTEKHV